MPQDPIKHVVLLMMENRSFDHMVGALSSVFPELDGVDTAQPRVNLDEQGKAYAQAPTTTRHLQFDPKHEHADVMLHLAGQNSGFVLWVELKLARGRGGLRVR